MKTQTISIIVIALLIIAGAVFLSVRDNQDKAAYGEFATCLKDSGAKFYGAFWCPHCLEQKRMFNGAHDELPYVECSTTDHNQTQECTDLGIESYPTWEFADGERVEGVMSLEMLAEKTNCQLPDAVSSQ